MLSHIEDGRVRLYPLLVDLKLDRLFSPLLGLVWRESSDDLLHVLLFLSAEFLVPQRSTFSCQGQVVLPEDHLVLNLLTT